MESQRMVAGPDGPLAVRAWGAPDAPAVVLVHGYPDDSSKWIPVAERLARDFRVYAYDVRGAGASFQPRACRASYTLDRLGADFRAVLDAVSPSQPVHLVAHDWGSIQSWDFATDPALKSRLRSFTSISGPCLDHVGHWMRHGVGAPTARQRVGQLFKSWYIYLFHLPWLPELTWSLWLGRRWHALLGRMEGVPAGVGDSTTQTRDGVNGVWLYRANFIPRLLQPRARHAQCPVQVLVPLDDRYVSPHLSAHLQPWVARLWRREVPCSHWLTLTHPDLVADRVREFARHVDGAPVTPALAAAAVPPGTVRSALEPRHVRFDWTGMPVQWLPGDAYTTHMINVLHLLFPAGELWFCRVYNKVLPHITDPRVKADGQGFMRQEALHARSHEGVLKHYFEAHGLDTRPYTARIDRIFSVWLGERPLGLDIGRSRFWMRQQLGFIAAFEHFFGYLGNWVIHNEGLERDGAHPVMLDLLRWHGAEEVEHRAVAHDMFKALGGTWLERSFHMLVTMVVLLTLFAQGGRFLHRIDPARPRWPGFLRGWFRGARADRLPSLPSVILAGMRYFNPWFHPGGEGSTERALAYLARSPAASAAPRGGNWRGAA